MLIFPTIIEYKFNGEQKFLYTTHTYSHAIKNISISIPLIQRIIDSIKIRNAKKHGEQFILLDYIELGW
jgi:hypothetical protein